MSTHLSCWNCDAAIFKVVDGRVTCAACGFIQLDVIPEWETTASVAYIPSWMQAEKEASKGWLKRIIDRWAA